MADSLVASVKGPLVITDLGPNILYMNDEGLNFLKKALVDVLGKPYGENSVYPPGSEYCPITALNSGREAEVLYIPAVERYYKGKATYLRDKDNREIGYVIVSTNVTEIMQKQAELEKAVKDANKANASKGEFLARMSHEIRTPMNAIIGMTNIVKKKLSEKAPDILETLNYVSQIEISSQHLLGLLNDILDLSKIEAGKIELGEEPVDLSKLVNTVASIIRPRCEEKNLIFETVFDVPPPASFVTDPLRLRQVLINLLGNSVKFTPEGGRISFRARQENRENIKTLLEFSVADTGIGISKEMMGALFQPFEQGNSRITRRYGGTGLGLAISRNIVRLMGGDIAVKSKVGEGSVFSFSLWLPLAAVSGEEEVIENGGDIFKGKRALLVDDVLINRVIAMDFLSDAGLSVDEAEDGLAAVKAFEKSQVGDYDIIFMDVQMPNMDGYEAASAIRAMNRADAKTVPIVALTANAFRDDVNRALRHGMNAHLAKPIEIDKVLEVTARFLRRGS
jgi:signal transduction histidine kinase/ActR/RegA family two-component response regulator